MKSFFSNNIEPASTKREHELYALANKIFDGDPQRTADSLMDDILEKIDDISPIELYFLCTVGYKALKRKGPQILYFELFNKIFGNLVTIERPCSKSYLFVVNDLFIKKNASHFKLIRSIIIGFCKSPLVERFHLIITSEEKYKLRDKAGINNGVENFIESVKVELKENATVFETFYCENVLDFEKYLEVDLIDKVQSLTASNVIMPVGILSPHFIKPFLINRNVIYVPFNSQHNHDRFCTHFLTLNDEMTSRLKAKGFRGKVVPFSWPVDLNGFEITHKKNNSDGFLDVDALKICSVLGNKRHISVFEKYDTDFCHTLSDILKENSSHLSFVGLEEGDVNSSTLLKLLFKRLNVTFSAYETNLSSYYENYDVFLEFPASAGGGYGAILAILSGRIVLASDDSDISTYVHPCCRYSSLSELRELLVRLKYGKDRRSFTNKNYEHLISLNPENICHNVALWLDRNSG